MAFTSQRPRDSARASCRRTAMASCRPRGVLRTLLRCGFRAAWRRKLDTGPARLRESDGDRLLRRTGAMLALSDVLDFLANVLSSLGRRCLAPALRARRPSPRCLFRHVVPPLRIPRNCQSRAGCPVSFDRLSSCRLHVVHATCIHVGRTRGIHRYARNEAPLYSYERCTANLRECCTAGVTLQLKEMHASRQRGDDVHNDADRL